MMFQLTLSSKCTCKLVEYIGNECYSVLHHVDFGNSLSGKCRCITNCPMMIHYKIYGNRDENDRTRNIILGNSIELLFVTTKKEIKRRNIVQRFQDSPIIFALLTIQPFI